MIAAAHETAHVPGVVAVGHQDHLVGQAADGGVIVAVVVRAAGQHRGHTDVQLLPQVLQLSVQGGQEGCEVRLLALAQALEVDGNAAVRVLPDGLIVHRHLMDDLLHRLGPAVWRRQQVLQLLALHEYAQVQGHVPTG